MKAKRLQQIPLGAQEPVAIVLIQTFPGTVAQYLKDFADPCSFSFAMLPIGICASAHPYAIFWSDLNVLSQGQKFLRLIDAIYGMLYFCLVTNTQIHR